MDGDPASPRFEADPSPLSILLGSQLRLAAYPFADIGLASVEIEAASGQALSVSGREVEGAPFETYSLALSQGRCCNTQAALPPLDVGVVEQIAVVRRAEWLSPEAVVQETTGTNARAIEYGRLEDVPLGAASAVVVCGIILETKDYGPLLIFLTDYGDVLRMTQDHQDIDTYCTDYMTERLGSAKRDER